MARYYRRTFKKRTYRRRYPYYSRRRRYYATRRRYKRYKRRKVEYKRTEATFKTRLNCTKYTNLNDTNDSQTANKTGYIGEFISALAIGPQDLSTIPSDYIENGTGIDQRIGNKINPVKLRCFGTMTLTSPNPLPGTLENPVTVYVRMVIYQVRNGNPQYTFDDASFSSMNPIWQRARPPTINEASFISAQTGERLFSVFHGKDLYRYELIMNQTKTIMKAGILEQDLTRYTSLTKAPFRLGIGGSIKILKDKVYKLSNIKNSFSFRFKTKKPNRMVWPEIQNEIYLNNGNCPKNPIYICFFYIPTTGVTASLPNEQNQYTYFNGNVDIDLDYQLFYTDL